MPLAEQAGQVAGGGWRPFLGASLLWLMVVGGDAVAAQPPVPEAEDVPAMLLRQKLALLERVLAQSGDTPDGVAARAELESARAALSAGDSEAAEAHLLKAFPLAGRAARERAAALRERQARQRYEERLASVESLRGAWEAISAAAESADESVAPRVAALLEQGRSLAGQEKFMGAAQLADQAQELLVDAIRLLRDRQTLVSRLEFATPADEYAYEARRYQTYELLLQLAERSDQAEAAGARVAAARAEAARRHAEAVAASEAGRWPGALEAEQAAISALIAALGQAGIFVPQ